MKANLFIYALIALVVAVPGPSAFGQAAEPAKRSGHSGAIKFVAIGPDGKTGASAGEDGAVRIWELSTGKEIATLVKKKSEDQTGTPVANCVTFSPNGKLLAVAYDSGVRLWDTANWSETKELGDDSNVDFLAFSPDGTALATGEIRPARTVRFPLDPTPGVTLFNTASGEVIQTLYDKYGPIAFNPAGTIVAVAGDDGTVWLHQLETGGIFGEKASGLKIKSDSEAVAALAFDPSGKFLYCTSGAGPLEKTVRVWNVATLRLVTNPPVGTAGDLLLLSDGMTVVVAEEFFSGDGLTTINSRTSKVVRSLPKSEANLGGPTAISRDGKTAIITDLNRHDMHVLEVPTLSGIRIIKGHSITVTSLAFTPNGKNLLAGYDDESVIWWNPVAGTIGRIVGTADMIPLSSSTSTTIISPDGGHYMTKSSFYNIFESGNGRKLATELSTTTDVNAGFSPSGKQLIYSDSKAVTLYAVPSGKLLKRFPVTVHEKLLGHSRATLTHDGKTIAIASSTLTIRDATTGVVRRSIVGGVKNTANMAFSPDGKYLVVARSVGGVDGEIQVYAAATGEPVHKLLDRSARFAISPDSKVIAVNKSSDVGLDFADLGTGKILKSTDNGGHGYNYSLYEDINLAFSPDGAFLAVGGSGGIIIFDAKTGEAVKQMR